MTNLATFARRRKCSESALIDNIACIISSVCVIAPLQPFGNHYLKFTGNTYVSWMFKGDEVRASGQENKEF